jgi:mannosyl-3-phosphoglycerate phosphatase
VRQLKAKTVIFADLDGTVLDEKYECKKTKPILEQLVGLGGSVVFCSSKTPSEIQYYQNAIGLNEPFIAENGAAIYIPKNYFPFNYSSKKTSRYNVIRLGEPYRVIRDKLRKIKEKTLTKIIGFGDMALQELSYDTGLPIAIAKLAKKREHDEPFRILEGNKLAVMEAIKHEGLNYTQGGRYWHITGDISKGKASSMGSLPKNIRKY